MYIQYLDTIDCEKQKQNYIGLEHATSQALPTASWDSVDLRLGTCRKGSLASLPWHQRYAEIFEVHNLLEVSLLQSCSLFHARFTDSSKSLTAY